MEQTPSLWKTVLPYGIVFAMASIGLTLLAYAAGISFEKWLSYLVYLMMIGVLAWGTIDYRRKVSGGVMSYALAWKVGTVMSIYAAVPSALFTALLYLVIDPQLIQQMFTMLESELLKNPDMTDEMIDLSLSMFKKMYTNELMPLYSLFGTVVMGSILSLIVAIFVQRKANPML